MSFKKMILIFFFLPMLMLSAQGLSSKMVKNGENSNIGWLSSEGINTKIIGAVKINGEYPDIFVQSDSLYPGIYRYSYQERDENGKPIFGNKNRVTVPFDESQIFNISVFQMSDYSVNMVWLFKNKIYKAFYDVTTNSFIQVDSYSFPSFSNTPTSLSAFLDENQKLNIVISVPSELTKLPPGDPSSNNYIPFTLAGVWRGELGKEKLYRLVYENLSNLPELTELLTSPKEEVLLSIPGTSRIKLDFSDTNMSIIAGSYFGTLYFYKKDIDSHYKQFEIIDRSGNFIRNLNMSVAPIAYPNEIGAWCDILAAGRGGIFFYQYTGEKSVAGNPIYEDPVYVLEKNSYLYGGTMPTPTVVDADGDGLLDIVSGNAEGNVLLFKNTGSNVKPKFLNGEYLKSNNKIIQIEPGYSENPSGPIGARLGYVGANIIDWDNDGVVDLLMNDARGKHSYFKGQLVGGKLSFKREKSLYLNGLELRGTQRCRPGVGLFNGKMAYITLDDDDEFHLYWQIDSQNLEDGGKLKLQSGTNIKANYLYSLGTGRIRFELCDWDNDGVKDLLLGVDEWHSVPNISNGLPAKGTNPHATVLFMKNLGTEVSPRFDFPKAIQYREEDINLGVNAAGVAACMLGEIENGNLNLLISDERGRFYLFEQGKMNPSCEVPDDLPGVLIDKTSSSFSSNYFSAPSIVSMGNSIYISYDLNGKTIIQRSNNKGVNWQKVSELDYGKNGALFVVDNILYLIGSSHNVDNCVILKSENNGVTWTVPNSPVNGLLLTSSSSNIVRTTSSPAVIFNNRVYKSIEQIGANGNIKLGFMSASTDNMMARTSWITTNYLEFDTSLSAFGTSWQDGKVLLTAQNNIINITSIKGGTGNAVAILNISSDNKTATFDTENNPLTIPGGSKDFTIKYDAVSGKYWAITNLIKNTNVIGNTSPDLVYNTLTLLSSSDLINWKAEKEIFHTSNYANQGFPYSDWIIVGNDIIGVTSVSWNDCEGSVLNIEHPNFVVSFVVNNFRNYFL